MTMSLPTTKKKDFNAALNGYRGLCAMLVFVFHVGSAGILLWPSGNWVKDSITYLWTSLTYGVEMFFMISGFVILASLLRHRSIGGFLHDRVARIFSAWVPALCAVTLMCIVLQIPPLRGLNPIEAAALFVGNLFLLPPIVRFPMIHQVSWSLSYEWVFYLTAAMGLFIYRKSQQRYALLALWLTLGALFIMLFPRALFFVTGVLVFKYRDWFAQRSQWLRFPLVSLLIFLVAWRATGAFKAHMNDTIFDYILDGRWIALVIAFIASLHMFASVTLNASRQATVLCGRIFQFLGNISYSFYLWHALVMAFMKKFITPLILPEYGVAVALTVFAVGSLAVSLPVSWISWRLFEVKLANVMRGASTRRAEVGGTVRAA
ncbi:peptidoglycan/LPS O-acetylase OafA/YrhL [Povalibacter uvarum]|uniref:Peptidoglycan/LPS O-acetylase OafA/YrhL n=1 Tax=Povalibacter uvarum TaxID=732238 RepID=A0A841HN46_9GAMM|nr:acyltransferase [Povalibacter uvarum]MBB6094701.1 peptidoglycan/LPS O-acetylase OafA/YrhL [Povalibacter uvarum]